MTEVKNLSEILTQKKEDKGDGLLEFTLSNSSADKEITFTYTLNNADNAKIIGTSKDGHQDVVQRPEENKFTATIFPGDEVGVVAAAYCGGWKSSWKWKSPPSAAFTEKQSQKLMTYAQEGIECVRRVCQAAGESPETISASALADLCESYGVPFCNLRFPPQQQPSIFRPFEKSKGSQLHTTDICVRPIPWLRPCTYLDYDNNREQDAPALFVNKIEPNDIDQGSLGSCYLLCCFSCAAEFPRLIRSCFDFPGNHRNPTLGIYRVRVAKTSGVCGWFQTLTLDDYIPTANMKPLFAKNREEQSEMYIALMEKAYAALHGSYKAIVSGNSGKAQSDFFGLPYDFMTQIDQWENKDELFEYLKECDEKRYLLTLSTPGSNEGKSDEEYESVGLAKSHCYSLLAVKEYEGGHKLVKVRNPWGNTKEWNGKWSDDDPNWTEDMKQALGFSAGADGTYWMAWEDVWDWFTHGNILYTLLNQQHKYSAVRSRGVIQNGHASHCIRVTLTSSSTPVDIHVVMHQRGERGYEEKEAFEAIRIGVVKQSSPGSEETETFAKSGKSFMSNREVNCRTSLTGESGSVFYILPTCYTEGLSDKDFNLSLFIKQTEACTVEFCSWGSQTRHINRPEWWKVKNDVEPIEMHTQIQTPQLKHFAHVETTVPAGPIDFRFFKSNNENFAKEPIQASIPEMLAAQEKVSAIASGQISPEQVHQLRDTVASVNAENAASPLAASSSSRPNANSAATAAAGGGGVEEGSGGGGGRGRRGGKKHGGGGKKNKNNNKNNNVKLEEEMRVWANYRGRGKEYKGVITYIADEGQTIGILYDDSDFSDEPPENVRPLDEAEEARAFEGVFDYVGQLVQANWKNKGSFCTAVITNIGGDGVFDVRYDDGMQESGLPKSRLRMATVAQVAGSSQQFYEGQEVECRFKGRGKYYPGWIAADNEDGSYHVRFEDGDEDPKAQAWLIRPYDEEADPVASDLAADHITRRFFDQFDFDSSEYLDTDEAMSAFMSMYAHESPSQLLARIKKADLNSDGKLSYEEFKAACQDVLRGQN